LSPWPFRLRHNLVESGAKREEEEEEEEDSVKMKLAVSITFDS